LVLLRVDGLKTYFFTYRGVVKAVDNVSFTLEKGETLGLAGESGCGKSTTAYSIMKLIPPPGRIVDGKILLDDKLNLVEMSESEIRFKVRWKRISMVFQGAMNALNPVYTIGHQLCEALTFHANMTKEEALERCKKLLTMVGLEPDIVKRYPHELSGGMKQRVFIAMALVLSPDIIICDEPTTALDVVVQAQILNLLKELQQKMGMSIIIISHDLGVIAELSDKIAVMYAGKIAELGPAEKILLEPAHPYTKGLISSIPRLTKKVEITWIPGLPPDLINPPEGCRFHPRCPQAMDICKREEPPTVKLSPDHEVMCWLYG